MEILLSTYLDHFQIDDDQCSNQNVSIGGQWNERIHLLVQ
jgi:hypothetical protein